MSARRRDRFEDRLLELLLERSPEAERELAELRAEPEVAGRIAALEAFLRACRAHLAAPAGSELGTPAERELRTAALAERVLARTVREDLSLGGDLRLLRGFVGERLRASVVLRLVAASLLLHLLAVPVLAWVLLVEVRRGPLITFEFPEEPPVEEVEEPPIELPEESLALEELLGELVPAGDGD